MKEGDLLCRVEMILRWKGKGDLLTFLRRQKRWFVDSVFYA